MALPSVNPSKTAAWKSLQEHFEEIKNLHMRELFKSGGQERVQNLSLSWDDFFVDFSKNRITSDTVSLLVQLAQEAGLETAIEKYFQGDLINETEGRAVLHTALRAQPEEKIFLDGVNIVREVNEVKARQRAEVYGVADYRFTNLPGQSAIVPMDEWVCLAYRKSCAVHSRT